ncbi:hypothetical protein [Streptomyces cyaneofuscatus]|uniref:hypothetical protein n=1 Tax=Streptomyces cyaneofuscatus TaxID=66883 RepID=UPI00332248B0
MHAPQRAAGVLAALVLAAGGLMVTAQAASASESSPSAFSCTYRLVTGNPHKGAAITCTGGGWFTGAIDCKRTDTGLVYTHFGNRVAAGGTSTVWCDANANVIRAYGIQT